MLRKISISLFVLAIMFSACKQDTSIMGDVELTPSIEQTTSTSNTSNKQTETLGDLVIKTATEEQMAAYAELSSSLESRGGGEVLDWFSAGAHNNWLFPNAGFDTPDFHQWGVGLFQFTNIFNITPPKDLLLPSDYLPNNVDFGKLDIPWFFSWGLDKGEYGSWLEELFNGIKNGEIDYDFDICDNNSINWNFPIDIDFGDKKFFDWNIDLFNYLDDKGGLIPYGLELPVNYFPLGYDFENIHFPAGYDLGNLDVVKYGDWLGKVAIDFGKFDGYAGGNGGYAHPGYAWGYEWEKASPQNYYYLDKVDYNFNDPKFHDWGIGAYEYNKNVVIVQNGQPGQPGQPGQNNQNFINFDKEQFPIDIFEKFDFEKFDFDKDIVIPSGTQCNIDVPDYKNWLESLISNYLTSDNTTYDFDICDNNSINWNFPIDIDFGDKKFFDWNIDLFNYLDDKGGLIPYGLELPVNYFPLGYDFENIHFPAGYDLGNLDVVKYGDWLGKVAIDFGKFDGYAGGNGGYAHPGYAWGYEWEKASPQNYYYLDKVDYNFNDPKFHDWGIGAYEYNKNVVIVQNGQPGQPGQPGQNNQNFINFDKEQFPIDIFEKFDFEKFDFDKDIVIPSGTQCNIDVPDYKNWLENLIINYNTPKDIVIDGWNVYDWKNAGDWNNYNFPTANVFSFGDDKFIDWSVGLYDFCQKNNLYVPNNLQFPQNYAPQWYNVKVDVPADYKFPANINVNDYKNWLPAMVYYAK